jgi:hypothetical protein
MSRSRTNHLAALAALLMATTAHAAPAAGVQARSNGPNMPQSEEVVPSDIRPQDPAITDGARESGARSRWHDIQRPPVRPQGL